jgi:hypothetical protein
VLANVTPPFSVLNRSCTKDGHQLVVSGASTGGGAAEDQETQFELPKQLKQHFLEVGTQPSHLPRHDIAPVLAELQADVPVSVNSTGLHCSISGKDTIIGGHNPAGAHEAAARGPGRPAALQGAQQS